MTINPLTSTLINLTFSSKRRSIEIVKREKSEKQKMEYKLNSLFLVQPKSRSSSCKKITKRSDRDDPLNFFPREERYHPSAILKKKVLHFKQPFQSPFGLLFIRRTARLYAICLRNEKVEQRHMHINSYIRIPTPLWLYTRTIIEYKISGSLYSVYIFSKSVLSSLIISIITG